MKRWLKTYFLVVLLLYIGGKIKAVIGGYRYFCEGWKSCDSYGNIIEYDVFVSREIHTLLLVTVGSILVTFFVLRAIDQTKKENAKDDQENN